MSNISLEQAIKLPIGDIAKLGPDQLYQLLHEATYTLTNAKNTRQRVEAAIAMKYAEHIRAKRQRLEKDTGVIHIEDNGYRLTTDTPKKTEWDQDKLEKIVASIHNQGDNPLEYVDVAYKVPERKYTAWPESIRQVFEPARTVKTGNPTYALAPLDKEGA
ncbi:MAG: hypothetical protein K0R98_722 [Rickettsiaceae bacterium]|jgi:hypothetical protein|nr:hypothetical protein [Rickettsiaceae bacterium]